MPGGPFGATEVHDETGRPLHDGDIGHRLGTMMARRSATEPPRGACPACGEPDGRLVAYGWMLAEEDPDREDLRDAEICTYCANAVWTRRRNADREKRLAEMAEGVR